MTKRTVRGWDSRDSNEPAIRAVLHKAGVQTFNPTAKGFPDLVCLTGHVLWLMEIKSAKGVLTKEQAAFRDTMMRANSGYYVVRDPDQALDALKMELARR